MVGRGHEPRDWRQFEPPAPLQDRDHPVLQGVAVRARAGRPGPRRCAAGQGPGVPSLARGILGRLAPGRCPAARSGRRKIPALDLRIFTGCSHSMTGRTAEAVLERRGRRRSVRVSGARRGTAPRHVGVCGGPEPRPQTTHCRSLACRHSAPSSSPPRSTIWSWTTNVGCVRSRPSSVIGCMRIVPRDSPAQPMRARASAAGQGRARPPVAPERD